jgi:hypothetical protein
MVGYLKNVCPQPQPNIDLKVQDKNKKPNSNPSAGTIADSELQPRLTTSCPTIAKPPVMCRRPTKNYNK